MKLVGKRVPEHIVIPFLMSTSQPGSHVNASAPSTNVAVFISEWEHAAEVHAKNGAWHDVVHCCNKILQIQDQSKTNFNALYLIGVAYMNLGRGLEAFINLSAARDINPHHDVINSKMLDLSKELKFDNKSKPPGRDTASFEEQTPVLGRRRNPEQASIEGTAQNNMTAKRRLEHTFIMQALHLDSHSVLDAITGQLSESAGNGIEKGVVPQMYPAKGSVHNLNGVNMDPRMIYNRPNSAPQFESAANPSHQVPSAVVIPQANLCLTSGAPTNGNNLQQHASFTGINGYHQQYNGNPIIHAQQHTSLNLISNDTFTSGIPSQQQQIQHMLHLQQLPHYYTQQPQIHSPLSCQEELSQDDSSNEDDLDKEINEIEDRLSVLRSELNDCEERLTLLKGLRTLRAQNEDE